MTANPERAMARMERLMYALAVGGAAGLLVWRGWTCGLGWLLGCAASMLNFRWLRRVTDALGSEVKKKDRKAVLLVLRYVLLGGFAYVILKFTAINLPAALAGLFVPVAAVIVEILIELVYARN